MAMDQGNSQAMKLTAPIRHADAEHDAGEQALAAPSPNANVTPPITMLTQTEALRDRAGEAGLQHGDGAFPGRGLRAASTG